MSVKSSKFDETRVTSGVYLNGFRHFFYEGQGRVRQDRNDGQPDILNAHAARNRYMPVDGSVRGIAKITHIAGAPSWFSVRSMGPDGTGRTVYLTANTLTVVDGKEQTLGALYADHRSA